MKYSFIKYLIFSLIFSYFSSSVLSLSIISFILSVNSFIEESLILAKLCLDIIISFFIVCKNEKELALLIKFFNKVSTLSNLVKSVWIYSLLSIFVLSFVKGEFISSIKVLTCSFWKILKLKLIFEVKFFTNWLTNSFVIFKTSPIVASFNLFLASDKAFSTLEKSNWISPMNEFSQVYNDSFIFMKLSFNFSWNFWELFFILLTILEAISFILVILVISSIFILSKIDKYLL